MLRDYQEKAVYLIREEFKKGNRKVMLVMPTGAGKTTVFTHMMREALKKEVRSMMLVRGRQLVQQAHEKLMRENTPHGVRMSNHWARNYQAKIQLASIDTIVARQEYPDAKLIIIDEAHMATSEGYKNTVAQYPDAYVVGVTATPYTRESLRHVADVYVKPITIQELFDQGYLVKPVYWGAKPPDLKGLRQQNGDWVNEQLKERMSVLSGDIVKTWIKRGESRPTIGFAVNIEHSLALTKAFNDAGIPAEHIEAGHSFEERKAAIKRLESGETKVLWNVGILCTGVDIPCLGCIIMARPTLSYSLYIQQLGRGTRCDYAKGFPLDTVEGRFAAIEASNKKDFIVLDHSGNVTKHGYMNHEPEIDLDGRQKYDTGMAPKQCGTCYMHYTEPHCPVCPPPPVIVKDKSIIIEDVELVRLDGTPFPVELVQFVQRKKEEAKKKGYRSSWVYMQVKETYGKDLADEIFPKQREKNFGGAPPMFKRKSVGFTGGGFR